MTREEAILLLNDMKDTYDEIHENTNYEIGYEQITALDMAIEALSAEAVQGEWIKTVNGNSWNTWWVFKCPNCGATIEDKQRRSWEYNFCPNCGARMKGADNETD